MRGGIFFHPSDQDLPLGTPVGKNATWPQAFCKEQNRNRCNWFGWYLADKTASSTRLRNGSRTLAESFRT